MTLTLCIFSILQPAVPGWLMEWCVLLSQEELIRFIIIADQACMPYTLQLMSAVSCSLGCLFERCLKLTADDKKTPDKENYHQQLAVQ